MKINTDELSSRLTAASNTLPRVVLINSHEPLLIEEALDGARASLTQCGFSERIKYQLETGFDWSLITGSGQAMSLFAQNRIIELRVPKSLGTTGTKAITEYCENPSEEDVLIITMPLLDKRQRSAKWVKAIESVGWLVDGYSINAVQFPAWIKQRLQSRALRVEPGVVELLCDKLEGNLLAAAQEIDKLKVLAKDGALSLKLVNASLADQAQFDVYALTDMCLLGHHERVLRIKGRLQSEGVEPVIVVWALAREIRTLTALASGIQAGQHKASLFKQYRIWSQRESLFNAALSRLDLSMCHDLLMQVAHLDQTVKGQRYLEVGDIWHQIEQLCGQLCGHSIIMPNPNRAA